MGLLPVFESTKHPAVIIDCLKHLCQRYIVPLREEFIGWAGTISPGCRGGDVEGSIGT